MSILLTTQSPLIAVAPDEAKEGLVARFMKALIASREAQARRAIRSYLASLSDARLADLGFTPDQIPTVKAYGSAPGVYWL